MSLLNRSRIPWLAGLVLLAATAAPSQGAGLTSQELAQRSKEIEDMTAMERLELQRNWDLFQKLPEDRKRHYREMYEQIQQDRGNGGRLHDTQETYSLWLQTLTPGERADLREAADPAKKLELVHKFKAKQDQRQSHALEDPAWGMAQRRGRFSRFVKGKLLSSAELKSAMQALSDDLPAGDRENVAEVETLKDKWRGYQSVLEASARQAGGRREWPNLSQQKVIESALKTVDEVEGYGRMKDDNARRRMFGRLILNGLSAELFLDGEAFLPKQSELPALFEQMPNAEREQIMRDLPREMIPQLMRKYRESKRDEPAFQEFEQIRRNIGGFIFSFWRDADLGGPRGIGGPFPGGGRPGERPRGNRDGDGEPARRDAEGRRPDRRFDNRPPPP